MSTKLDFSAFYPMLKERYDVARVQLLTYSNHPTLALLPKRTDWGGRFMTIPVILNDVQGLAPTLADAQTNKTASNNLRWEVTHRKAYGTADIDGPTIRLSQTDPASFLRALTAEMDSTYRSMAHEFSIDLFRSGDGVIGRVGAVSGNTITLLVKQDVYNFETGMKLSGVDGTGGDPTATIIAETYTVTGVDRNSGKITVDAIGSLTATDNDYLIRKGCAVNGGSDLLKIDGLTGWLVDPSTVTSTPFNGINRTLDPQRLGGCFMDASAESFNIKQALIHMGARVQLQGGRPKIVIVNPIKLAELEVLLDDAGARYHQVTANEAQISFTGINLNTGGGAVSVVADPACPYSKGFMLDPETWVVHTAGGLPEVLDEDGKMIDRSATADQYEVRYGILGNVYTTSPGANGLIHF